MNGRFAEQIRFSPVNRTDWWIDSVNMILAKSMSHTSVTKLGHDPISLPRVSNPVSPPCVATLYSCPESLPVSLSQVATPCRNAVSLPRVTTSCRYPVTIAYVATICRHPVLLQCSYPVSLARVTTPCHHHKLPFSRVATLYCSESPKRVIQESAMHKQRRPLISRSRRFSYWQVSIVRSYSSWAFERTAGLNIELTKTLIAMHHICCFLIRTSKWHAPSCYWRYIGKHVRRIWV